MKIDINEVLADMLAVMKVELGEGWSEAKSTANRFMQNRKERLQLLAEFRLSGDITQEKFEQRLKDEKLIAETELHAVAIISKVTAQNAANAAIDVLNNAVKVALNMVS